LKKPPGPTIYPTRVHLSWTVISLWLKFLRIHCGKPKKKEEDKYPRSKHVFPYISFLGWLWNFPYAYMHIEFFYTFNSTLSHQTLSNRWVEGTTCKHKSLRNF